MLDNTQLICNKCSNLYEEDGKTYCFKLPNAFDKYQPDEYLKGSQNPEVLIIAINPAGPVGTVHSYSKKALENFNPSNDYKRFYNWYKLLSLKLFSNWCNTSTNKQVVAETDLYKCFSPSVNKKLRPRLAENCFPYLEKQLSRHSQTLKVIICNGRDVENKLKEKFKSFLSNEYVFNSQFRITSQDLVIEKINLKTKIIFSSFIQGHLTREERSEIGKAIEQTIIEQNIDL